MTDLLNKRSIEIRTVGEDGSEGRGSGFPIGQGLVMTCAHVVKDTKSVWVRWCEYPDERLPQNLDTRCYNVTSENGNEKAQQFVAAKVNFCGDPAEFDIALLETFHPEGAGYFSFSNLGGEVGDIVCGIGFPKATKTGLFRAVPLNGKVDQAASLDKNGLMQIALDRRAENPEDWRGASGAPVVLKGNMSVIGVHRITEAYLADANTVWAVPWSEIWARPDLRLFLQNAACSAEALNHAHRSHIARMRTGIEIVLEKLEQRPLNRLAGELGIDHKVGDTVETCAVSLSQNAEQGLDVLSRLWQAYSSAQPMQKIWCELIHLVATCTLQSDEAGLLVLGTIGTIPREFAAGNPVSLEVNAAQVDGRPVDLGGSRRAAADMPAGKNALNITSAESGPGRDTDVAAAERDLMLRGGWRLGTDPGQVESYMAREPLLSGPRRQPLTDEDRRELAGVFRRARIVPGESTYYTAHVIHHEPEQQDRADRIAKHFQDFYPGVLIIPLDPEKWDKDADRHATLISTVPISTR